MRWPVTGMALLVALGPLVLPSARALAERAPIKSDEQVVFFTTAAARAGSGWLVPVHGWVFEPERGSVWRGGAVSLVASTLGIDESDRRAGRFSRVASWFLVDNERGKRVPARVGGTRVVLPASGRDGHTQTVVSVPAGVRRNWLRIEAQSRDGRRFRGRAQLVEPRGVSVVSDLDDTIKVTDVLAGKRRILERTFLEPFEAVPGMAGRYQGWREAGAVFHYVSASPWQLYPALAESLASAGFPAGTLHLREFRVRDNRRWNLLASPRAHKLAATGELFARFPGRRFVLVGDTGESDPEVYGELARRHPRQVAAIALRQLPNTWSDSRRRRALARVGARIILFSRPDELSALGELR